MVRWGPRNPRPQQHEELVLKEQQLGDVTTVCLDGIKDFENL